MNIIIIFLSNSLFIWGIHVCFREGMIFGFLQKWLFNESSFSEWLRKPLIGCPACMGFWWGIPGAILVCDNLFEGFVYCICMIGFNWLISDIKSYFGGTE